MNNTPVSNPNDFKVVQFYNNTDFDFTPEMGCMFDSRPIFGISGFAGIKAGERISLPYHIGNQIALNLAKQSMIRNAPPHDPKDLNPAGAPLWTDQTLEDRKNSFLTDMYVNEKPVAMSETDKLIAQVAELNKIVRENYPTAKAEETHTGSIVYKDKAEVISELVKRGINHNPRDKKVELEKLLV